jgi:hypothetical protein
MALALQTVTPSHSATGIVSETCARQITPEDSGPIVHHEHIGKKRMSQVNRKDLESSVFAQIEQNSWFQNTTLVVIVLNAIWIFVDVEWNHTNLADEETGKLPLEPTATVIENIFCVYFTVEVLIRLLAFDKKYMFWKDGWFVFDSILVTFMVIETWAIPLIGALSNSSGAGGGILSNFSSFRLLRLLRLTRMARIMRFFPELMTLVKGMVRAMRAVSFILLFLVLVMYVFAIIFTSQIGKPPDLNAVPEVEPDLDTFSVAELKAEIVRLRDLQCEADPTARDMFASMGDSMMTLFTNGVLGDNLAQTLHAIWAHEQGGLMLMLIFIFFMMVSSFTLLNMLIGVLCQVIEDCAAEEEESRQIYLLQECLNKAFNVISKDEDGVITQEEWANWMSNEEERKIVLDELQNLGIEEHMMEERLNQMQETLFGDRGDGKKVGADEDECDASASLKDKRKGNVISFEEFANRVAELRWDTPAGALDVEMLKSRVTKEDRKTKLTLERIQDKLQTAMESIVSMQGVGGPGGCTQQEVLGCGAGDSGADGPAANDETAYLRQVPTELLFHALRRRTSVDFT